MSAERSCPVCSEPVASGAGEPCVLCGAWFHFSWQPGGRKCGVPSTELPGFLA